MQPTFNFPSGESFVFPSNTFPDPQPPPPQPLPPQPLFNDFAPSDFPPHQGYQPQVPIPNQQPYAFDNYDPLLVPQPPHPHQYHQETLPYPLPDQAPDPSQSPATGLRIRLPHMAPTTRGASRHQPSSPTASGSEYHESNASMEAEEAAQAPNEEEEEEEPVVYGVTSRGRRIQKKSYVESPSEDDPLDVISPKGKNKAVTPEDDDEEEAGTHYALRTRSRGKLNGFIESDGEDGEVKMGRYPTRNRSKNASSSQPNAGRVTRRSNGRSQPQASSSRSTRNRLSTRRTRSSARNEEDEDGYVDEPSSGSGSADGEGSMDEAPVTSPEPDMEVDEDADLDAEGDADIEPEQDGKPYSLRQRTKINYAIPPPLEEMRAPPKPRAGGSRSHGRSNRPKPPGWSATGAELSRWMGAPADDSVRATNVIHLVNALTLR